METQDAASITINEDSFRDSNPKISSLREYAKGAREYDLVRDISVGLSDEADVEITILTTFSDMPFNFSNFGDACSFLHVITKAAEQGAKTNG